MIGLLRAFCWLRFKLLVNGLRARRRDGFEQVSRVTRLLVAAIVAVSLVPGSILLAVLAFFGGRGIAAGNENAMAVTTGARAALALVTIVVTISPILKFGGSASSTTRLALLPIPRRVLFAGELAAQLTDPWILLLVPALVALPSGLLLGGAFSAAAWSLLAGGLVLLVLASLSSAASLLGALIFRNRRLGEMASVGLLLCITLFAYLPMITTRGALFGHPKGASAEQRRAVRRAFAFEAKDHPWVSAAPWELFATTVERSVAPAGAPALVPAAGLALSVLLFGGTARWSLGRLMDAPGDRRASGRRSEERVRRVPGLSPAASAIARTFFRLVTRSVRGRVILFTAPLPALLLAFVWRKTPLGLVDADYTGPIVVGVSGMLALMSMTAFLTDQFAVDRAGLTLTFLGPATALDLVAGKAIGGLAAFAIPMSIGTIAAAALHPRGSIVVWAGALMCVLAAYLVQSPAAATLSAWFPAPFDLAHLRRGNPHPLASILGLMLSVLGYTVCAGSFALTLALTQRPVAGLMAATFILAVAAGIARLGWPLAAAAVDARRENLAMVAQGR
jgi:hypothetical protein